MIDDASAIIVQAVAFVAAEILHKEESSVSSCAGRIAVGGVRRSFTKFIAVLATPIFNVHIACPSYYLRKKRSDWLTPLRVTML
jgi:hypothetical protein